METKEALLKKQIQRLSVDLAATQALARAGADANLLMPAVAARLQAVENDHGDFEVQAFAETGVRAIGAGGKWATVDELVADFAKNPQFAPFFGKATGITPANQSQTRPGVLTRAAFEQMAPAERAKAMRDGQKLTD